MFPTHGLINIKSLASSLAIASTSLTPIASAQIKAFEGAEGFGQYTTGARTNLSSASVYHVTNLNDSGAGSFRDAVSQANRFIVFDVSGIIKLNSTVVVQENVTIAGQTSPGGITLYGEKVSFSGADNVISRYIAIRKGNAGVREDSSGASNGRNMMFDHMSVTWGVDETFSLNWDGKGNSLDNITVQNSIIGQGLDRLGHSAGGLMTLPQGGRFSIIKSLFTDNVTRNPKVRGENEFINNVVYGWETAAYIMGDTNNMESNANAIGNYFIEGPVNGSDPFRSGSSSFHIYAEDNWVDTNRNGVLDGSLITNYPGADVVSTPHDFPTTTSMSAQEALSYVLENAGLSIFRDAVDTRMIEEVQSYGTLGGVINRETDLFPNFGSDPQYVIKRARLADVDQDGIADNWEQANGLSASNNSDWRNLSSAGYTQLEEYVNELGEEGETILSSGGDWNNISTWNGALPTLADDVIIAGNLSMSSGNAFARTFSMAGNANLTGGTLDVFDTATVSSGNLNLTNNTATFGQLLLASSNQSAAFNLNSGSVARIGTVTDIGGNAIINFNGGTLRGAGDINVTVDAVLGSAGGTIESNGFNGTFSGNISGTGQLSKTGWNTLTLSGNNSYTGGTSLQGSLKLAHNNAAGTGDIVISSSGGQVVLANGVTIQNNLVTNYIYEILDVKDANATATFAGNISMNGNRQIRLQTSGSNSKLILTGHANARSQIFILKTGNVTVADSGSITSGYAIIGRSGSTAHLAIVDNATLNTGSLSIGGGKSLTSGRITVSDNAVVTLNGSLDLLSTSTSNSFSEVNLDDGSLIVNGFGKSSTGSNQISELDLNGGMLRYGGNTANTNFLPRLTGLTANVQYGGAHIHDNGQSITIGHDLVHDAALSNTDGGLTKYGTGTLTLTGNNTYNGQTIVEQGKLVVNSQTGTGRTTVKQNASLGGSGSIQGGLDLYGTLTPGNSPGTLTVQDARFFDGSRMQAEIASDLVHDQLNVLDTLTIDDGATLELLAIDGDVMSYYEPITLIQTTNGINGQFSAIEGVIIDENTGFAITYDENNVYAQAALLGDANLDGQVSLLDLDILGSHYNQTGATWLDGDFNGDSVVSLLDLDILGAHYGQSISVGNLVNIPEPAGLTILVTALSLISRRRRSA